MKSAMSLRARLTLIILCPLMLISVVIGYWAYHDAQARAAERFDLSLLSIVLAISRDAALSDGDALSPKTMSLLRDTSGGVVFYHVYAPDGVFVTGFATPPVPPATLTNTTDRQVFFDAVYRGGPVRALRFTDAMTIDGLTGDFNFTVWQDTALRDVFVASLTQRTFLIITTLLIALGLIVWFGVRVGLRPLLDLQDAIALRSSKDLAPIRRPVPPEARGIVNTLNTLLTEMTSTLRAKDDFISNAAHQLRNPIAGVLSMSEAVKSATTLEDAHERSEALVIAARDTSSLANALLAFERAKSPKPIKALPIVSLHDVILGTVARSQQACDDQDIALIRDVEDATLNIRADPVLTEEAILNLVTNALVHGGRQLSRITIRAQQYPESITVIVSDDGVGMAPEQVAVAMSRFGQLKASGGSGLGLPIVQAVVEGIGGQMNIETPQQGLTVTLRFPRIGVESSTAP